MSKSKGRGWRWDDPPIIEIEANEGEGEGVLSSKSGRTMVEVLPPRVVEIRTTESEGKVDPFPGVKIEGTWVVGGGVPPSWPRNRGERRWRRGGERSSPLQPSDSVKLRVPHGVEFGEKEKGSSVSLLL
jgi:hypothetical protein